jgi:hypothetical protein
VLWLVEHDSQGEPFLLNNAALFLTQMTELHTNELGAEYDLNSIRLAAVLKGLTWLRFVFFSALATATIFLTLTWKTLRLKQTAARLHYRVAPLLYLHR